MDRRPGCGWASTRGDTFLSPELDPMTRQDYDGVVDEAVRRTLEQFPESAAPPILAAVVYTYRELLEEGWKPPVPVKVLAFREWYKVGLQDAGQKNTDLGHYDNGTQAKAFIAGWAQGREAAKEDAQPVVQALKNIADASPDATHLPVILGNYYRAVNLDL